MNSVSFPTHVVVIFRRVVNVVAGFEITRKYMGRDGHAGSGISGGTTNGMGTSAAGAGAEEYVVTMGKGAVSGHEGVEGPGGSMKVRNLHQHAQRQQLAVDHVHEEDAANSKLQETSPSSSSPSISLATSAAVETESLRGLLISTPSTSSSTSASALPATLFLKFSRSPSPTHDSQTPISLTSGVLNAAASLDSPNWLPGASTPSHDNNGKATSATNATINTNIPDSTRSTISTSGHTPDPGLTSDLHPTNAAGHQPQQHVDSTDSVSSPSRTSDASLPLWTWGERGLRLFSSLLLQPSTPPADGEGAPRQSSTPNKESNGGGKWELPEYFKDKRGAEGKGTEDGSRLGKNVNKDAGNDKRWEDEEKAWRRIQNERRREMDPIHQLFLNPLLFDPVRTPRYPIVLCHGLYGFDSRGPSSFPSMRMHYWANVLRILRGRVGAEVIVTSVPGTGSIAERATRLDAQLQTHARGRGVNFLAHSMGGLDCRHLISHIRPREYVPLSLTSVCTPHRGSPFMDWCAANLGLGKLRQQEKEADALRASATMRGTGYYESEYDDEFPWATNTPPSSSSTPSTSETKTPSSSFSLSSLPSSFTTLLLSIVDSPAYANLTSAYLNDIFNPCTPDDPKVKYWSVASRMGRERVSIWHPFWLPKMVLDGVEESIREGVRRDWLREMEMSGIEIGMQRDRFGGEIPLWADEREWGNDGLVTVQSAKWGEFLGVMEGADHWEMRGARGIEFGVDLPGIPAIGLGSSSPTPSAHVQAQAQASGDGWGFGDWTRFVTAWRKSDNDRSKARAEEEEQRQHRTDPSSTLSSSSLTTTTAAGSPCLTTPEPLPSQTTRDKEKEANLDSVVRSSTESLSAVFDWLVEKSPSELKKVFESEKSSTKEEEEKRKGVVVAVTAGEDKAAVGVVAGKADVAPGEGEGEKELTLKELSVRAVEVSVGGGGGGSQSTGESSKEKDKKAKAKPVNELAKKEDLERFYVSLARKMWDAGL